MFKPKMKSSLSLLRHNKFIHESSTTKLVLRFLLFVVYFCSVFIHIKGQSLTKSRHHSLLRQRDTKIDQLNRYMNSASNNVVKAEEKYKKQALLLKQKRTTKTPTSAAEKAKFLKDVFLF